MIKNVKIEIDGVEIDIEVTTTKVNAETRVIRKPLTRFSGDLNDFRNDLTNNTIYIKTGRGVGASSALGYKLSMIPKDEVIFIGRHKPNNHDKFTHISNISSLYGHRWKSFLIDDLDMTNDNILSELARLTLATPNKLHIVTSKVDFDVFNLYFGQYGFYKEHEFKTYIG